MYLYLLINIASFSIPFLYSFENKMNFIRYWKLVFVAISITAIPFLIWDIIFTDLGVWGFNSSYYLGFEILKLPLEELLFFICIPYASIFIHYAIFHFYPKLKLSNTITLFISGVFLFIAINLVIFNFSKYYTVVNFVVFSVILSHSFYSKRNYLNRFYISFLAILVPFFLVNGILTGSFIENEVVWYDNSQNLGIRIGTIPVEDIFYAFSMLYPSIVLIEYFKSKFNYEK